jgi:hypothetical protein
MLLLTENISAVPDLTHPQELLEWGQQVLKLSQWVFLGLAGLGIVMAALNFSYRQGRDAGKDTEPPTWLNRELDRYGLLLQGLPTGLLLLAILIGGFFLCSTLSNRYHHWEQSKITQVAETVAGERVEQLAPQVSYTVEEPYTTLTYLDGKATEVEKLRKIDRYLSPQTSQTEVKLTQITDPATLRLIYQSEFAATYAVSNSLETRQDFVFEVPPPTGYNLLQDYRIEQDGQRLEPKNQGEYRFPLRLSPGESTRFRVTYKAQGAPRWVYNANGRLLSKFGLSVLTHFANADFASGIVPTEIKPEGQGTRFTWLFEDNVSVQNPFGVFTATQRFRNTGILPRLLLLAPAIFLWWVLLLLLSTPLRLRDLAIAAAVFFACLLSLAYTSRLVDPKLAWGLILPMLLWHSWGLGTQHQTRWTALVMTLSGAVLPVLAMLVPYTGLTLGISGLISVAGLMVRYWNR